MITGIDTSWVVARYSWGSPQGKTALALGGEGVGYVLMNPQRSKTEDVIVAFRRPNIGALPPHLSYATSQQATMLEKKRADRSGVKTVR